MILRVLIAGLVALTCAAEAGAVTFHDVRYAATAVAVAEDQAGFDDKSSPPDDQPLAASAAAVGLSDVATAGATAAAGLLTASADASAAAGIASAVATASFSASFENVAFQSVTIDFMPLQWVSGSGTAETSLYVLLTSAGTTLFDGYVTGPWQFAYAGNSGSSVLELTLSSEVSAGFPDPGVGDVAAFGQASFAVSAVPLPAGWLLMLAGLGPVIVRTRRAAARETAAA